MEPTLKQPASFPRWGYLFAALAAIVALFSIYKRFEVESMNKAASLAVEYETVEALAAGQGIPVETAFRTLKSNGLESVVLSEDTVSELTTKGAVTFPDAAADSSGTHLTARDPVAAARLSRGLSIRFPQFANLARRPAAHINSPDLSVGLIRGTAVGLNPDQAGVVGNAGLTIVARCNNPSGVSDAYVAATIGWAHELGAAIFLPEGDQVLGRRESLGVLIDTLRAKDMLYASPEFTKIGGDEEVVDKAPELVLRLHSALAAELDKLPLAEAIDRYARAARERNQRILLVRPVTFAAARPLDDFGGFLRDIKAEIAKQGGAVGPAHPFQDSAVNKAVFVILALLMAPVIWATVAVFVRDRRWQIAGAVLLGLLAVGCWSPHLRPFMAFLGAVTFPITAFIALDRSAGRFWPIEYVMVSAISLVGGLCVAGLLNGLPYFVHAQQFPGVKVAVFLPIVLVGGYFFARLSNLKGSLSSPISWGQALLALVMLAALALMITRTGNDNPAAVSGIELKFRAILDTLLFVRPRTKEFLIGNPLLVVGIGMLLRMKSQQQKVNSSYGGWTALALMAAAIGQTSIVNTMCHIHTPVTLSLARIGMGLLAGGILGAVLWAIVGRWRPEERV